MSPVLWRVKRGGVGGGSDAVSPEALPLLELESIRVERDGRVVLDGITLQVRPGEFLAVVGHNGAGKTTLLQVMAGLLPVQGGRVTRRVGRGGIGYVPQKRAFNDQLGLQVADVVALRVVRRASLFRRPAPHERERVRAALETVGLGEHAFRPFHELSGGEQQRVLLARALAGGARLLLLDEPEQALDLPAQRQIYQVLAGLCEQAGVACVVVSHDVGQVSAHAHRMLLLDGRRWILGTTAEVLASPVLAELYGPGMAGCPGCPPQGLLATPERAG